MIKTIRAFFYAATLLFVLGLAGAACSSDPPAASNVGGGGGVGFNGVGGVSGGASGLSGSIGVGVSGSSGGAGLTGGAGSSGSAAAGGSAGSTADLPKFSFFVVSYAAIQRLSGSSKGFGGDLRYGQPDGLSGADKICSEVAETSLPGAGAKMWRAFLSVTKDASGNPVNAIDRIGPGPWYDRNERLFAMTTVDALHDRPQGGDATIADDFPNEDGVLNHDPDGTGAVDNHDMLTGTGTDGKLYKNDWTVTCHDWTSSVGSDGKPRVGHSWPRSFGGMMGGGGFLGGGGGGGAGINGVHWMSALDEAGCGAGVNIDPTFDGPPNPANPVVGSGGGYGGFYCFALTP